MKKRKRGRRLGLFAATAALATMAFGSTQAQAVPTPFGTTFDNAYLKTTLPGNGLDILGPPDVASIGGTLETNDGTFTVPAACAPPAGFCFPSFSGDPIPGLTVAVTLSAAEPITGTLEGSITAPTGKVTTNPSDFVANLTLTTAGGSDSCTISPITLAFTHRRDGVPEPVQRRPVRYAAVRHSAPAAEWRDRGQLVGAPGGYPRRWRQLQHGRQPDQRSRRSLDRAGSDGSGCQHRAAAAAPNDDAARDDPEEEVQEGSEAQEGQVRQEEEEEEEVRTFF